MKYISIISIILFIGCGTIKETTTTETLPQTIPAVIVHDTTKVLTTLPINSTQADSIGRWYLENYCKGTENIDQNGLKATINFYVKTKQILADSLNRTSQMILTLQSDIKEKEKIIQGTKITTETKTTPGDWWILWASMKFWLPAGILGMIIGAIGFYLLRSKLKAFLPI